MPRGRKRKALLETSGDEDAMDDVVESALASAEESTNDEEKTAAEKHDEDTADESTCDDKDIASNEKLDKIKAQEELKDLDILVCGKCHHVFFFIEQLVAHKETCSGISTVFSNTNKSERKSQVWAFVLFKAHKLREKGAANFASTSWQLYQKWSQLDERTKQTWVEAGKALQEIHDLLPNVEVKPKVRPKVTTLSEQEQQQKTLMELQKELEDDETQVMSTLGLVRGKTGEGKEKIRVGLNQVCRKSLTKKDPEGETELEVYTIEKIVAKRVNPKTRQPEYLVKWIGFPSTQNTWEHISNMATCMKTIQEFEKSLARQKARKAMEAGKLASKTSSIAQDIPTTPGGRPIRSSALKAMDQVKEWVGGKRAIESEEDEEEDGEGKKSDDFIVRKKLMTPGKSPLFLANSRGVVRVDSKTSPPLSSGVYILSTNSGLIKIDDPTAAKLQNVLTSDKKNSDAAMMINETEVRKIPAGQSKIGFIRKEITSGIVRKENSPSLNLLQKSRNSVGKPVIAVGRSPVVQKQIILGSGRQQRPLPGPVQSPLRPPPGKPKITIKPKVKPGAIIRSVVRKEKKIDGDFVTSLTEDDGGHGVDSEDKGNAEEGHSMPDIDDDGGVTRVTVSPGGSLHQVVSTGRQRGKQTTRSLLAQRRTEPEEVPAEPEMISIEGEDGVIYQITPEQQQMLMQNGSLTMDAKDGESFQEHSELLIENGQITERRVVPELNESAIGEEEDAQQQSEGQQAMLLEDGTPIKIEEGEGYSEDGGVLTLENAVQEAVSQGEPAEVKAEDPSQLVAQIVQAEPPTPGGGPRKVVLLLPDGTLLETEMEEEQYQALEFEK